MNGEGMEPQFLEAKIGNVGPNLCFQCVLEFKMHHPEASEEQMMEGFGTPEAHVRTGVTLVPSWQQKQIGPSLVVTTLAMPTCFQHIEVREKTAVERAIEGGHILPGTN